MRTNFLLAALLVSLAAACGPEKYRPPADCRPAGAGCGSNGDCCSYGCGPATPFSAATCQCNPLVNGICSTSVDCCLPGGPSRCADNACVAGCRPNGETCRYANSYDSECCNGYCGLDAKCACDDRYTFCSTAADCCTGHDCASYRCIVPSCSNPGTCTTSSQCCQGDGCRGLVCKACAVKTQVCPLGDADCCDGLICDTGACRLTAFGDHCGPNSTCSPGLTCKNNVCRWATPASDGQPCIANDIVNTDCQHTCPDHGTSPTGTCCTDSGGSCDSTTTSSVCCGNPANVCLGPVGQSQTCGACIAADRTSSCSRSTECCQDGTNACTNSHCCKALRDATCSADGQCCSGHCAQNAAAVPATACCSALTGSCSANDDCCSGLLCFQGTCREPAGNACSSPGTAQCANSATCMQSTCCYPAGSYACTASTQCCGGSCVTGSGTCSCSTSVQQCTSTTDCCTGGATCRSNPGLPGTTSCCAVHAEPCVAAGDCCDTLETCTTMTGLTGNRCCRGKDVICTLNSDCCTGNCLGNSTCQ